MENNPFSDKNLLLTINQLIAYSHPHTPTPSYSLLQCHPQNILYLSPSKYYSSQHVFTEALPFEVWGAGEGRLFLIGVRQNKTDETVEVLPQKLRENKEKERQKTDLEPCDLRYLEAWWRKHAGVCWGGWREGIGMGNTCKSMADSCQCVAVTTTIL